MQLANRFHFLAQTTFRLARAVESSIATRLATRTTLLALLALTVVGPMHAQIPQFKHIVVIVQENRTPDNLFQGLCIPPYGSGSACGKGATQYDIVGSGMDNIGNTVSLLDVPLGNTFDAGHSHAAFNAMCHLNTTTNVCQMDGLNGTRCDAGHTNCSFEYVHPQDVEPYISMAHQYGWANFMFQTNQGPSSPAHQFLFGGTSATSAANDALATFVADNPLNSATGGSGCLAGLGVTYKLISPATAPNASITLVNNQLGDLCFSRPTIPTLLEAKSLSWKYYTNGINNIWSAPNWIRDICHPNPGYTQCTGTEWTSHVALNPATLLTTDLPACALPAMSWVIPTGQNSDHPSSDGTHIGGPSWVSSIINTIGISTCTDTINGKTVPYWQDTAVVVTWDDWGGFYDHEPPMLLSAPNAGQGDYQYGFRVPMLFVSAYTPVRYINNNPQDFGSILRFVERNFALGTGEGSLGFADARSKNGLAKFYDLTQPPRAFTPITAPLGPEFFINDKRAPDPTDSD